MNSTLTQRQTLIKQRQQMKLEKSLKKEKETPRDKIKKKAKRGLKTKIASYRKDIYNTFYDEKALNEVLNEFQSQSYQTENLSDAFNKYLEKISQNINKLFDKAREYVKESYENGTKKLTNKDGETVSFDVGEDEEAIKVLSNEQLNFFENLKNQQKRVVNNTISKGLEKGKPVEKIAKDIKKSSKSVTRGGAMRIARSEVVKAHTVGQIETMKKAGVETYNFITSPDYTGQNGKTYPCKLCKKLQGAKGREKIYEVRYAGTSMENPLPVTQSHPNCFDEKTEVLTAKGFRKFKDFDEEKDLAQTFNQETGYLEPQKAKKIVSKYKGRLISIKNKTLDILGTPDHRILIKNDKKKSGYAESPLMNLIEQSSSKNIPTSSKGVRNNQTKSFKIGKYEFNVEDYAKFLGYFLAEGSTSKNGRNNTVKLACCKDKDKKFFRKLINKMGIKATETKTQFIIYDKTLQQYFVSLSVGAKNKTIPSYVFDWHKRAIDCFLQGFKQGDGSENYWGTYVLHTTSEEMASQLQSLMIMTGKDAFLRKQKRTHMKILGRWCKAQDIYSIQERQSKSRSFSAKKDMSEVEYNGKIYCVQVPNDNIVIRRNGKIAIIKNCNCTVVIRESNEEKARSLSQAEVKEILSNMRINKHSH